MRQLHDSRGDTLDALQQENKENSFYVFAKDVAISEQEVVLWTKLETEKFNKVQKETNLTRFSR